MPLRSSSSILFKYMPTSALEVKEHGCIFCCKSSMETSFSWKSLVKGWFASIAESREVFGWQALITRPGKAMPSPAFLKINWRRFILDGIADFVSEKEKAGIPCLWWLILAGFFLAFFSAFFLQRFCWFFFGFFSGVLWFCHSFNELFLTIILRKTVKIRQVNEDFQNFYSRISVLQFSY